MTNVLYRDESYRIIGACFEVYNQIGSGFGEAVYQESLALEFQLQGIPFVAQPKIELQYKGHVLEQFFRPDFICFDKIIVEIKALAKLIEINKAQALNYLNATMFELVLLINFGSYPKLDYQRIVKENGRPKSLRDEIRGWANP